MKMTLEQLWEQYLQLTEQNPKTMHPIQYTETKRAFFGAIGLFIDLQLNQLVEVPEDEAVDILQGCKEEVSHFWELEVIKRNAGI